MKQVGIRIKDMKENRLKSSALIQIKPFEMDFEDRIQKIIEDYSFTCGKASSLFSDCVVMSVHLLFR